MKNCPYCAEEIQEEAIICKYCKSSLNKEVVADKEKSSYSDWDGTKQKNSKPPLAERYIVVKIIMVGIIVVGGFLFIARVLDSI